MACACWQDCHGSKPAWPEILSQKSTSKGFLPKTPSSSSSLIAPLPPTCKLLCFFPDALLSNHPSQACGLVPPLPHSFQPHLCSCNTSSPYLLQRTSSFEACLQRAFPNPLLPLALMLTLAQQTAASTASTLAGQGLSQGAATLTGPSPDSSPSELF